MKRQTLWNRAAALWLLVLVVWGTSSLVSRPAAIFAQEGEATEDAGTDATATEGKAKDKGTADAPAAAEEKSFLMWLIETSGVIGGVLLILSIYFVATAVRMFMELRMEVAAPQPLLQECENLLKTKDLMGIYKAVKKDESFFGTVLTAGLSELQHGLNESREMMERVADAQVVEMEKKISMLAVLGTLGPMIGLLGTLKGMIASFSVIAMSDTQLKASQVAGGISEALVLTFEGVALSVPAIYFFALFRNRIASISTATLLMCDEFLRRIYAGAQSKTTAPTTTA